HVLQGIRAQNARPGANHMIAQISASDVRFQGAVANGGTRLPKRNTIISGVVLYDRMVVIDITRFYPALDGKAGSSADVQRRRGRNANIGSRDAKIESLADLPRGEADAGLENTIVGADVVAGIAFAAPPTDQAGRLRKTGGIKHRQQGIGAGDRTGNVGDG